MEFFLKKLSLLGKRDWGGPAWFARTRRQLMAYAFSHPPVITARMRWWMLFRTVPALVALALIVVTSGVTFAAQESLPGDLLYSWKVGVESVESVFIVGARSQAHFEVARTAKRLHEVAELAVRKPADAQAAGAAQQQVADQIKTATQTIAEVEVTDKDGALEAALELNATLQAHREVLNQIEAKANPDDKQAVHAAIDTIEKTAPEVEVQIDDLKTKEKDNTTAKPAIDQKNDILVKLAAVQTDASGSWEEVVALDEYNPLRLDAEAKLYATQEALVSAQKDITDGNYIDALTTLQTASQLASEARALLKAASTAATKVQDILVSPVPTAIPTSLSASFSPAPSVLR